MKELSWYYMLFDNRKTMEMIPAETLKKVLLRMFDYTATGEYPNDLNELENIAFCGLMNGAELARSHFFNNSKKGREAANARWHKTTPETPQKAKEEPKPIEPIKSTTEAEKPKRNVFKPPTIDEVQAYCNERKNGIDAEAFVAFYTSKNWMIGKNKMSNWKMAVITWEKGNRRSEERRRKEDVTNDRSGYSTDDFADFIRFEQEEKNRKETL